LAKTKELRGLSPKEREERLKEARNELMHERGVAAMGGAPPNPGKIRAIRSTIARILTIQHEEKTRR
jgi:large subunit ribosomal protein L29